MWTFRGATLSPVILTRIIHSPLSTYVLQMSPITQRPARSVSFRAMEADQRRGEEEVRQRVSSGLPVHISQHEQA